MLVANVSDPDGGAVSGRFFARTVGGGTWNLVNGTNVSVTSGQQARLQLPVAQPIGQGIEWQVQACDATACSALSALQTGYVSPALGAGSRPSATRVPFPVGDRISAQVDVGSGNLLVTTNDLTLPGVGQDVTLGVAYNSLQVAAGSRFTEGRAGLIGLGWSMRVFDLSLTVNPDGTVVYRGADGRTATFTAPVVAGSATTYTSPVDLKSDLKKVNTSASDTWELSDHASNSVAVFELVKVSV